MLRRLVISNYSAAIISAIAICCRCKKVNWVLNAATQGKQQPCVQRYQIKAKTCWALRTQAPGKGILADFCVPHEIKKLTFSAYRISANSFRGNYSFLNLALFTVTFDLYFINLNTCRGNYSRKYGMQLFGVFF